MSNEIEHYIATEEAYEEVLKEQLVTKYAEKYNVEAEITVSPTTYTGREGETLVKIQVQPKK